MPIPAKLAISGAHARDGFGPMAGDYMEVGGEEGSPRERRSLIGLRWVLPWASDWASLVGEKRPCLCSALLGCFRRLGLGRLACFLGRRSRLTEEPFVRRRSPDEAHGAAKGRHGFANGAPFREVLDAFSVRAVTVALYDFGKVVSVVALPSLLQDDFQRLGVSPQGRSRKDRVMSRHKLGGLIGDP